MADTEMGVVLDSKAMELRDLAKAYESLDRWNKAVLFLKDDIAEDMDRLRELAEENPVGWWAPFHFSGGMAVRNRLRNAGFGELDFGIENMDNIYVALLSDAIGVSSKIRLIHFRPKDTTEWFAIFPDDVGVSVLMEMIQSAPPLTNWDIKAGAAVMTRTEHENRKAASA